MTQGSLRAFVLFIILSIVFSLSPVPMAKASVAEEMPASNAVSELLQFTSAGHVFGFKPDEYYLSNATYALRVQFVGANYVRPLSDEVAQEDGQTTSPLQRVTYPNLWSDITLTYDATNGGLARSTYRLESGADVRAIHLRYNAPVTLNVDGSLSLAYATGSIGETAPVAWQEVDGRRVPVDVRFDKLGEREVGFALGRYDPAYPLLIDPTLTWNTFLGDRDPADAGRAIAVDGSGNTYIAGTSNGTWGTAIRAYNNNSDGFVAKLDPNGALLWNTFLGGSKTDSVGDLALDSSGNIYVVGYGDSTWGAPMRAFSGTGGSTDANDAFVAKLDATGTLVWNTFLGGSNGDSGFAIAVGDNATVYVVGASTTTWGAPIRAHGGGYNDSFVIKLDSSGALLWNTFLGGSADDHGHSIALDESGNAHVAGVSAGTWGTPVRSFGGGSYDGFAAKLDASGSLTWNTFLGGTGDDRGLGVAADESGSTYVTGLSTATWGAPVRAFSTGPDGYAAKLDVNGSLTWNTFLGGSGDDEGFDIALDSGANVYVTGVSNASWGAPVRAYTGSNDVLAAKLDASGALLWNTFLGGNGDDSGAALITAANGAVSVTGSSAAAWGSPTSPYTGGSDGLAGRLDGNGVLIWNTFLGASGSGNDTGTALAADGAGNLYVLGKTNGSWGAPTRAYSGGGDAFVAKLNSSGALVWNAFLGGSQSEDGNAVAVDANGNVYAAGKSNATWGTPIRPFGGAYDAFVAKLDPNGILVWNTFLGASGSDTGFALAVDSNNDLVAAGESGSTWGTPIRAYNSSTDTFVAKLDTNGGLVWNTFLGGGSSDNGYDVTADSTGNFYLAGTSGSSWGTPVRAFSGIIAGYAAKLSPDGALAWNTFLGSGTWLLGTWIDGFTNGRAIAVDVNGNVFVGGDSDRSWGAPVRAYSGLSDAFTSKLSTSGALAWNTFLGGSGDDKGFDLRADGQGGTYVTGNSRSSWGTPTRPHSGLDDAYAVKLASDGVLEWNTFLGGSGSDKGNAIVMNVSDVISVAGTSDASWGAPGRPFGGGTTDAFVARIDAQTLAVSLAGFAATARVDRVQVTWETVSEIDTTGFNLYRSTSVDGQRDLLNFVPAQAPGGTQGASYVYDDLAVQIGQTYWYWLEDIDLTNVATWHGPVSIIFDSPTVVSLAEFGAVPAPAGLSAVTIVAAAVLATALGAFAAVRRR